MSQPAKKIGLALSGGGLRASFFHIGLLAQMAEQGLLQSISVISTVSGGSIIGALYYLHLKKLLESKADKDISNLDYIKIIQTIEADFLKATEKNIRMQLLSDFKKNLSMWRSDYSRSDRIAELYNDYLYQAVSKDLGDPIEMKKLKIYPLDDVDNFHPHKHNEDRTAKVPILVINATTLNSGRNWQFTASTMGEPPSQPSAIQVDKKPIRLRRATKNGYDSMLPLQQNFKLAHAVAASACVPGLFEPIAINELYFDTNDKQNITPQLVDGGVYDNQGIESLLDNHCSHFIISDASGQMGMQNEVDTNPIPVILRVSSILQDRVRSESVLHLIEEKGQEQVIFIDLRKGLGCREISWNNQPNTPAEKDLVIEPSSQLFSVDPKVQEKLSLMRTDLDAFTEVEAYSLMLDAYQMSKADLIPLQSSPQQTESDWKFNEIAELMKNPSEEYLKQLDIAQLIFGKALHIFLWLWVPILLTIGVILFFTWTPYIGPFLAKSFTVNAILVSLGIWAATIFIPKIEKTWSLFSWLKPHVLLAQKFGKALLLALSTLFILFHLKFINPMYLSQGRIASLKKQQARK